MRLTDEHETSNVTNSPAANTRAAPVHGPKRVDFFRGCCTSTSLWINVHISSRPLGYACSITRQNRRAIPALVSMKENVFRFGVIALKEIQFFEVERSVEAGTV